jgi:hypothetical protein
MIEGKALIERVVEAVRRAHSGLVHDEVLYEAVSTPVRKNEFLFFIKPEITQPSPTVQLESVLALIVEKMEAFEMAVHDVRILSAEYLKRYRLMDLHYGVIADVSHHGAEACSASAAQRFEARYGLPLSEAPVLGGMQFLERYPHFNALSLDDMWQNKENHKLSGGTYVQEIRMGGERLFLLNGFHPRQLLHFTQPGRSIVIFRISSDISWARARTSFAGVTIPSAAEPGSLRRELFERRCAFGLPLVSQSYNGIHLSAGPVEGLIELNRFDTDLSVENGHERYADFSFGKALIKEWGGIPAPIVDNTKVEVDGKRVSVFDLTEGMEADEALHCLQTYFGRGSCRLVKNDVPLCYKTSEL